ncbi:MAG: hypothetical protein JWM35_2771 [Verrucomicrobia bacterium]|nr:hypothetical protein [Verrucomicrobiota bacterium]
MKPAPEPKSDTRVWVNDVHSRLNPTPLCALVVPGSLADLVETVRTAAVISVSGGRHAMGGQQFATDSTGVDMRKLNRILSFDFQLGLVEAEAGIQWPDLVNGCIAAQGDAPRWGIAQKQTGADTLSLGGSLSANVHGRGLAMPPIIHDVESFTLVRADGEVVRCSRTERADIFRLVIGGYGLFGIIYSVQLRLAPRRRVRRVVEIIHVDNLMAGFERRIHEGCLYGDFQFSIDEDSPDFLLKGVFSCYQPTDDRADVDAGKNLSAAAWIELLHLAYTNRAKVYDQYTAYYLSTHGQDYWSDEHQLGPYLPDYAEQISSLTGQPSPASLVISELYVPRNQLALFLRRAAALLRERKVAVIYGTVRLIERDTESFLPWARESYACIIFNLLTPHHPAGLEASRRAFLGLIDLAASLGGSYFLTYHRHADRKRVEACYPQFAEFLALKKQHDPNERFQSDWYRHYRDEFAGSP